MKTFRIFFVFCVLVIAQTCFASFAYSNSKNAYCRKGQSSSVLSNVASNKRVTDDYIVHVPKNDSLGIVLPKKDFIVDDLASNPIGLRYLFRGL